MMMVYRTFVAFVLSTLLLLCLGAPAAALQAPAPEAPAAAPTWGPRHQAMMDKGFRWLAAQQNPDGSFGKLPDGKSGLVAYSGLALRAFATARGSMREQYAAQAKKAAEFIAANQQENGAIYQSALGNASYTTSVAVMGLAQYDSAAYAGTILKARKYLAGSQIGGSGDVGKENPHYGGWNYDQAGKPKSDLSNVQFALDALAEAGLDKKDPVWQRAVAFIQRCQNRSESNDSKSFAVGNDGGFIYDPGIATDKSIPAPGPDGKQSFPSYASMTYAGLKSLLHADVSRDDPRVKAAIKWIFRHYTLDENYGLGTRENPAGAKQGLFYYYYTFAKTLATFGNVRIVDGEGRRRDWTMDLADKLGALQAKEGFWVNAENPRWWEDDPVLVTCYALNALNTARAAHLGEYRLPAPPKATEEPASVKGRGKARGEAPRGIHGGELTK